MDKSTLDKYGVVLVISQPSGKVERFNLTMYHDSAAGIIPDGEYRLKLVKHALDNNNLHPAIVYKDDDGRRNVVLLSYQNHYPTGLLICTDLITEDDETLCNIKEIVESHEAIKEKHLKARVSLVITSMDRNSRKRVRKSGPRLTLTLRDGSKVRYNSRTARSVRQRLGLE